MATSFTKETKPTTNYTKCSTAVQGGGFDWSKFDSGKFDQNSMYTRESKPTTSFTKETKP